MADAAQPGERTSGGRRGGLAQDAWSKNPLGMFGITKTLVGYFAASIGMKLDVDNVLMRFLLAFFFYVFPSGFLLGDGACFAQPDVALRPAKLARLWACSTPSWGRRFSISWTS